jgi:hypothetical protein
MTARQQPAPGTTQADNKQLSLLAGELELPARAYLPAIAGVHQAIHIARQLERGTADAGKPIRLSQHNVLQLQRTVGNRAVVRLLHPARPPLQREGAAAKIRARSRPAS